MENDKIHYVEIKPANGHIAVNWSFLYLSKQKDSGRLACYIPPLKIHFTATDKKQADIKADALIHIFFDHFFVHSKDGLKKAAVELHKLGFRTGNDAYDIHNLSRNQLKRTKLKSPGQFIPHGFETATESTVESEMQLS